MAFICSIASATFLSSSVGYVDGAERKTGGPQRGVGGPQRGVGAVEDREGCLETAGISLFPEDVVKQGPIFIAGIVSTCAVFTTRGGWSVDSPVPLLAGTSVSRGYK